MAVTLCGMKNYPFIGRGVYRLDGRVVEEFGFTSLEVREMKKMPLKGDPRKGGDRIFVPDFLELPTANLSIHLPKLN